MISSCCGQVNSLYASSASVLISFILACHSNNYWWSIIRLVDTIFYPRNWRLLSIMISSCWLMWNVLLLASPSHCTSLQLQSKSFIFAFHSKNYSRSIIILIDTIFSWSLLLIIECNVSTASLLVVCVDGIACWKWNTWWRTWEPWRGCVYLEGLK